MLDILKRLKNSDGEVIEYLVKDLNTNNITTLSKDILINYYSTEVNNATLVGNGIDFRAKRGYTIETVVKNTSIMPISKVSRQMNVSTSNFPKDYYGKEFIGICRRIRRYAREGLLRVDLSKHKSNNGYNLNLFEIIRLCGFTDISKFVQGYLSVLQPYNLEFFQKRKATKTGQTWIVELGYSTKMIIKVNESDKRCPMVISFHESVIKKENTVSRNKDIHDFSDKLCAVITENVQGIQDEFSITAYIQTGFVRYNLVANTRYFNKDIALLDYNVIKDNTNVILDRLFDRMAATYVDNNEIPTFDDKANKLSFSARGVLPVNQLIMILDLYVSHHDSLSVKIFSEMLKNITLELNQKEKESIRDAIQNNFGIKTGNKLAQLMYKELE